MRATSAASVALLDVECGICSPPNQNSVNGRLPQLGQLINRAMSTIGGPRVQGQYQKLVLGLRVSYYESLADPASDTVHQLDCLVSLAAVSYIRPAETRGAPACGVVPPAHRREFVTPSGSTRPRQALHPPAPLVG